MEEELRNLDVSSSNKNSFERVTVGSKQTPCCFKDLEDRYKSDPAFKRFRIRLADFLNILLPSYQIPLPGGRIKLQPENTVSGHCIYRFLR
jgi:hypothetical protein